MAFLCRLEMKVEVAAMKTRQWIKDRVDEAKAGMADAFVEWARVCDVIAAKFDRLAERLENIAFRWTA